MIKEKPKKSKYSDSKTKAQLIKEYLVTVFVSIFISVIITTVLAVRAREEMLVDLFSENSRRQKMAIEDARQMIAQGQYLDDLQKKSYRVCMHVGELYETIGDYISAEYAYNLAINKRPSSTLKPYYKMVAVLAAQEKFKEANDIIDSIKDCPTKELLRFKTRSYIVIGDKYYSMGKVLSAAKSYEQAKFYYDKFTKKDKKVEEAIQTRIINAYIKVSDVMVKSGMNSDAIRYLKKAESYDAKNFSVQYKMAIVLAELDPEASIQYFEKLLSERPQDIDYGVFGYALMKAANIADLDGRPTQAKYYRYKIHSIDLFINRKVIYKNDIEILLKSFNIKKKFFTYPLELSYLFTNVSNVDIINLYGDFVLLNNNKVVETQSLKIASKDNPMFSYNDDSNKVDVKFNKKIYSKKELENYSVKLYLYKDEKYKTLMNEIKFPTK